MITKKPRAWTGRFPIADGKEGRVSVEFDKIAIGSEVTVGQLIHELTARVAEHIEPMLPPAEPAVVKEVTHDDKGRIRRVREVPPVEPPILVAQKLADQFVHEVVRRWLAETRAAAEAAAKE